MKSYISMFICAASIASMMACGNSSTNSERLNDTTVVPEYTDVKQPIDTLIPEDSIHGSGIDSNSAYGTMKRRSTSGSAAIDSSSAYGTEKKRSKVDTAAHYKKQLR